MGKKLHRLVHYYLSYHCLSAADEFAKHLNIDKSVNPITTLEDIYAHWKKQNDKTIQALIGNIPEKNEEVKALQIPPVITEEKEKALVIAENKKKKPEKPSKNIPVKLNGLLPRSLMLKQQQQTLKSIAEPTLSSTIVTSSNSNSELTGNYVLGEKSGNITEDKSENIQTISKSDKLKNAINLGIRQMLTPSSKKVATKQPIKSKPVMNDSSEKRQITSNIFDKSETNTYLESIESAIKRSSNQEIEPNAIPRTNSITDVAKDLESKKSSDSTSKNSTPKAIITSNLDHIKESMSKSMERCFVKLKEDDAVIVPSPSSNPEDKPKKSNKRKKKEKILNLLTESADHIINVNNAENEAVVIINKPPKPKKSKKIKCVENNREIIMTNPIFSQEAQEPPTDKIAILAGWSKDNILADNVNDDVKKRKKKSKKLNLSDIMEKPNKDTENSIIVNGMNGMSNGYLEPFVSLTSIKTDALDQKHQMPNSNKPFRRIETYGEIKIDPKLCDNSFEAKKGAANSWGEKANDVLKFTKGKGFKHEKNKKKRGSYAGGIISMSVNSVRFSDDES
ncbi:unnamed protein product [Gordionus sp. m RMFG-2023]|uniref:nucleolar and coiled-body phosphoprotein 1-like n=1 Tax=Gordionus sp. m RMFG-2023 TaxID=3053472 RepID=UPI0030DEF356